MQILTPESAVVLAESAVVCMMNNLRNKGPLDPQKPLAEQMIQALYEDHRMLKLPHLMQTKQSTTSGQTTGAALSVLLKSGIVLWDRESQKFNFYTQKLQKQSAKHPHNITNDPEKYGYRFGSMHEVMRWKLRIKADVSDEVSASFSRNIGLRFIDEAPERRTLQCVLLIDNTTAVVTNIIDRHKIILNCLGKPYWDFYS